MGARRRRRRWLRGAIADTRAELEALAERDVAVARATRGTLHALEAELDALSGGGGPPLGTRPTDLWSPRDAWLARASEHTAASLQVSSGALTTLGAIERERVARTAHASRRS